MPILSDEQMSRRFALALLLATASGAMTVALPPAPALADDDGGDDGGGDDGGNDGGGGDGGSGDGGDDNDGGGAGGGSGGGEDTGNHGGSAGSEDDDDHEYAWRARQRGELRPLKNILARVRKRYGGRVLEVELKRKKGRAWYEIRILDRYDRVRKLRVPASRKTRNFRAGKR